MPTADCSRQHDGGVDDTYSKTHVSNRATSPGPAGNRKGLVNGDAGNLPETQISNKPDYENKGSNGNVSKNDLGRMSSSPEATSSPSKSTGRRQISFEKGDPRKEEDKEEGQADATSKQDTKRKAGDIPDSGSQTVYTLRNEGEIVNISTTDQPGTVGVQEEEEDEDEEDESEEDSEEDSEEETASESEAEEDTMDIKHEGVVNGDSGIVLTHDDRQTDSPVLHHDHHPQTDSAASQHEEHQSSVTSDVSSPQQQSPVRQPREINKDSQDLQNAASAIHVMQDNIQGLLCRAKTILGTYHTELSAKPLKDFVLEKEDFHDNFVSIGKIYSECEHVTSSINKQLKELRQTTNEMCRLINRKFREEDLSSWVDSAGDEAEREFRLREERTAQEKAVLAKAAEARAALANATSGVSETHEIIAQAEADAAEAEATAKKARAHADDAIRTAEEAKRAAEEKRKVEEEARKKAEAKAKIKAEEERKKREEEEKRLAEEAKRKGTSVDEERQREMVEREAREAERKNPKNWPRYIYSIDGGDFDPGVGCIIRAIQGSISRDDVEVKRLDQLSGVLSLYENEELISNIVHVQPNDKEKSFAFEEPFSLAIPHCAPRSGLGREPVIKMLQSNGRWTDLATNDVHFEDIKELRFVEARLKRFGTFAVIYKIKKDTMTFTKKGGKVTSSVDSRVTFTAKQMCFKQNVSFTLEVQSVDISLVSDLRKKSECSMFLASSPIIKLGSLLKKFQKPLTVTLPVPPNPSRLKRPGTSVNREETADKIDIRPATAKPGVLFTKKEEETPADGLHLVQYLSDGTWVKVTDVTLVQAKNKDIVTFDINKLYERFSIIRTKLEATNAQVEKIATTVHEAIPQRTIQLFLRQHCENLNEIIISCSNVSRVERSLRKLEDEGFEEGPPLSKEISVKEGQIINLKFRGNLKPETDDYKQQFVFNSHIPCRVDFAVETVDTFAQKGFDSYRGFAQLFTEGLVPKTLPPAEDNSNRESKRGNTQKPQPRVVMVIGEVLISELLMTMPKPEPEPPKRLLTAPLSNASEGPVDHELLFHLARELGDEWKKLAQYLNVRRMRIQAILRQNVNNDNTNKVYDMLTTWSKRLPRAVDRVDILYHALMSVGRADLAAELRDRKIEFKRQRSFSARDSYLRKAFVKIARDQSVTVNWKHFARRLGVSESDIVDIERSRPTSQDRCYSSLQLWREQNGDNATLVTLSQKLRVCRHRQLARDIESIA